MFAPEGLKEGRCAALDARITNRLRLGCMGWKFGLRFFNGRRRRGVFRHVLVHARYQAFAQLGTGADADHQTGVTGHLAPKP